MKELKDYKEEVQELQYSYQPKIVGVLSFLTGFLTPVSSLAFSNKQNHEFPKYAKN